MTMTITMGASAPTRGCGRNSQRVMCKTEPPSESGRSRPRVEESSETGKPSARSLDVSNDDERYDYVRLRDRSRLQNTMITPARPFVPVQIQYMLLDGKGCCHYGSAGTGL